MTVCITKWGLAPHTCGEGSWGRRAMYPEMAMGTVQSGTASCCCTSLGTSISTGPGRPVRAR